MQNVATTEGGVAAGADGSAGAVKAPSPKDRRAANKAKRMASGIDYNKGTA